MRTSPGALRCFLKLEIASKSIFTGISISRARAVRKKIDPLSTPTSFNDRPR